jgi:hypothetical protein
MLATTTSNGAYRNQPQTQQQPPQGRNFVRSIIEDIF